jgi:hypothetical protein
VHGVDEWSGTQDLVNALLQDPLQADADGAQGNVLRLRWKDREKNKPLIIELRVPQANPEIEFPLTAYCAQTGPPRQYQVLMQMVPSIWPPPSCSNSLNRSLSWRSMGLLENHSYWKQHRYSVLTSRSSSLIPSLFISLHSYNVPTCHCTIQTPS